MLGAFFSAHDLHEGMTTMIVCFKVSSGDEIGTHHQKLLYVNTWPVCMFIVLYQGGTESNERYC